MTTTSNDHRFLRALFLLGILGAAVMFAGDMLLYGDTGYTEMTHKGILATMRSLDPGRVMAGGAVGPLAASLYCFGFYAVCGMVRPEHPKLRLALLWLFCLGAFFGGAYHSHYPHLAFATPAQLGEEHSLSMRYTDLLGGLTFAPWVAASLLFAYAVLRGMTRYRRYVAAFAPFFLSLLNLVVIHLPAPVLIVVAGGWNSILFAVFFSICLAESRRCGA